MPAFNGDVLERPFLLNKNDTLRQYRLNESCDIFFSDCIWIENEQYLIILGSSLYHQNTVCYKFTENALSLHILVKNTQETAMAVNYCVCSGYTTVQRGNELGQE